MGFPGGSDGKESPCQCRRRRFDPWVGKIPWRRKWQATPVFLPGETQGQRSLADYRPWGCKELDTAERLYSNNSDLWIRCTDLPNFFLRHDGVCPQGDLLRTKSFPSVSCLASQEAYHSLSSGTYLTLIVPWISEIGWTGEDFF